MADFPVRGMVTLTFLKDSSEPVLESESDVLVERWLKLADRALALTTAPKRRHRHRTQLPRFSPFPSRNV